MVTIKEYVMKVKDRERLIDFCEDAIRAAIKQGCFSGCVDVIDKLVELYNLRDEKELEKPPPAPTDPKTSQVEAEEAEIQQ